MPRPPREQIRTGSAVEAVVAASGRDVVVTVLPRSDSPSGLPTSVSFAGPAGKATAESGPDSSVSFPDPPWMLRERAEHVVALAGRAVVRPARSGGR